MNSRRTLVMITACMVALSGAACSGSSNGSPGAAGSQATQSFPQPTALAATPGSTAVPQATGVTASAGLGACALITRDEAEAARGIPLPEGKERHDVNPFGSGASSYCAYGGEVSIFRADLGDAAPNVFAQYRQAKISESDYQVVAGLGDEAFVAGANLTIRVGRTALIINVGQNTNTVPNHLEKEKGLAVIALGRL